MREADVTLVCCYNDGSQYKQMTDTVARQNVKCEVIGIDNCGQRFSSCASALNAVLSDIKTDYVIFAHQDIELPEPDTLERVVSYLKRLGVRDILGVAGAVENKNPKSKELGLVLSNVYHGDGLCRAGEEAFAGMTACDTVDECFFGGHTKCFADQPFNEALCDNWHLYAVERCLNARVRGAHVYVCDVPLIHHSSGKINHSYNVGFRRIAGYYAKRLKCIRTVCGSGRTDFFYRNAFYWKRELLIWMKRY